MLAIRLAGAKRDLTGTDRVAWKLNRMTPYVSSPLLYDDTLYFLRHNQNILSRLEPATRHRLSLRSTLQAPAAPPRFDDTQRPPSPPATRPTAYRR
jgi:hypothetical protein